MLALAKNENNINGAAIRNYLCPMGATNVYIPVSAGRWQQTGGAGGEGGAICIQFDIRWKYLIYVRCDLPAIHASLP